MRPDEHKRRASRRYQTKLKAAGDSTAADVAQSRRRARGRGRGGGGGGSRVERDGGNAKEEDEEDDEEEDEDQEEKAHSGRRPAAPAHRGGSGFSRRKLTSNIHRYDEPSAEDELAAEAESGVDRQMVDFLDLLKSEDDIQSTYDPSTYFQFKEEKGWDGGDDDGADELYASLMQIRFNELEESLATVPLGLRLGIEERDLVMIDDPSAFDAATSAPIVPKALRPEALIVKKPGDVGPAATTVTNVTPATKAVVPPLKPRDNDEGVPVTKSSPTHKLTSKGSAPRAAARPGTASTTSRGDGEDDFDRFLDEIDGGTGAKDSLAKRASPATLRGLKHLARPPSSGRPGPGASTAVNGGKDGEDWLDDVLGDV